jgi:hypothetical protein
MSKVRNSWKPSLGLDALSRMKLRQSEKIRQIKGALIASGYDALDDQARAIGLSRSTAWTVLNGHHKSSGISTSVLLAMLTEPHLPAAVRQVVMEYIEEKTAGLYGDKPFRLRQFVTRLSPIQIVQRRTETRIPSGTARRPSGEPAE